MFDGELGQSERPDEPPVNVLSLRGGALWPVVWLRRLGLRFVTVVVVEDPWTPTSKPPYIELPYVTAAVAFLEDLASFLAPYGAAAGDFKTSLFAELHVAVAKAAPFGKPMDTNWAGIASMVKLGFPASDVPATAAKRPAWKPILYRGRQRLEFRVQERIQCAQYDNELIPDRSTLSGLLLCKAELEGQPEVSLCLSGGAAHGSGRRRDSAPPPMLSSLTVDPCVQLGSGDASGSSAGGFTKLTFTPPLEPFTLAKFSVASVPFVPIRGFYQMKPVSPSTIRLLVQLKLSDRVHNAFEYCEVLVPTFNRGPIVRQEASMTPSNGTVALMPDRKAIVWSIGTKFSSKNLESSLSAVIHFDPDYQQQQQQQLQQQQQQHQQPPQPTQPDDPFLTGPNSYVQLRFKMVDASLSGLTVDVATVSVYPQCKPQIVVEREIVADEYLIWNSVGQARHAIQ